MLSNQERIKAKLGELEEAKKKIEIEVDELTASLEGPGLPGLTESLIDKDGFPRQDVDVVAVRSARHRIAVLKTDYKQIMGFIEKVLHELHAESCSPGEQPCKVEAVTDPHELKPFCWVDQIIPTSVADQTGIRVGDQVLRFGSVCLSDLLNTTKTEGPSTHGSDSSAALAQCFKLLSKQEYRQPDVPFTVSVARGDEVLHFTITLGENDKVGCHLAPL